eukprot:jgi/Mesvir1/4351/Mv02435-RA.1
MLMTYEQRRASSQEKLLSWSLTFRAQKICPQARHKKTLGRIARTVLLCRPTDCNVKQEQETMSKNHWFDPELSEFLAKIRGLTDNNEKIVSFVADWASLCRPDKMVWAHGTDEEFTEMCESLVADGTFTKLKNRPNSYLARSSAGDVARVESRTFICVEEPEQAGPTNNWRYPGEMLPKIRGLMHGCMVGRTMYVIPFCMGPINSPLSYVGVEISDSAYVVANMKIMTNMGDKVLPMLRKKLPFVPCVHTTGCPVHRHEHMVADIELPAWPADRDGIKFISHFPENDNLIVSYGSGYGGNALLGKKCFALRIASNIGHREGWIAEHMLVTGVTDGSGEKKYIAAAFPSACGKTNLAMLDVHLPGWKWECVGDDIMWARIRPEKDGRMYAINPEQGIFGVAPGCSTKTIAHAVNAMHSNCIFTNVAYTHDGDVWWEGLTKEPPLPCIDWKGQTRTSFKPGDEPLAHPNSRFTAPIRQVPSYDPKQEDPEGVPLTAMMFGGRRSKSVPLVYEALNWNHGVYIGATLRSEQTAAAEGKVGALRYDPFAMIPFCGYNMGDYFGHWIEVGKKFKSEELQPRIFFVNWFRRDDAGKFLWPGFAENARVIQWILNRCKKPRDDLSDAVLTPIGYVAKPESIDTKGLDVTPEVMKDLLSVDLPAAKEEADAAYDFLVNTFKQHLPFTLKKVAEEQKERVAKAMKA